MLWLAPAGLRGGLNLEAYHQSRQPQSFSLCCPHCPGTSVHSSRGVAAPLFSYALSWQPYFSIDVAPATSASCRGTSHHPVAADVSCLSERCCGVTIAAQTTRPSLSGYFLGSDFCSPCYRWFYGHCRLLHGCAVRMETVQVHVASSLLVDLTWWPRRTTPMSPDLLPMYQSEASQPITKVTKHSAATAGQLPLGTGGEFPVDQRRIFGTTNRENFNDMFFHSVAFNRKFLQLRS